MAEPTRPDLRLALRGRISTRKGVQLALVELKRNLRPYTLKPSVPLV